MAGAYEKVMESRKVLVEQFISSIQKEGTLPWMKAWSTAALYYNPVSVCRYRGGNQLRLAAAAVQYDFQDTRWMTYKQAASAGLQVKKGAKGVMLEKWIFPDKDKKVLNEDGEEVSAVEVDERPKVSYFTVFNGDQIEGLEPLPPRNPDVLTDEMPDRLINISECQVKEAAQPKSCYIPDQDIILMPPRATFCGANEFCVTLLHEMGHSTGHESRLNRKIRNMFGSEDYAREELRAELSAAFCGAQLGIASESSNTNTAAYLQSWIQILQKDSNELFRAAADAGKIADYIVANYAVRYPLVDYMQRIEVHT